MHYPIPIHRQEAWHSYSGGDASLPVTERVAKEILSLPVYPELTIEEVKYICECINEFADSNTKEAQEIR
jgi:dTDP-4-amino-4,6-dideoxygalactose transaminase